MKNKIYFVLILVFAIGCASTTEKGEVGVERKQLLLMPSEQVLALSEQSYEQVKTEARNKKILDRNSLQVRRLNEIANRLIPFTRVFSPEAPNWAWEVHIITADDVNAYCMPGGKIMFYTGIIEKLNLTDAEIAAVMGHEIAHALREHGRERMSQELVKQISLEVLLATTKVDRKYANLVNTAAILAVTLPHGRQQETEADEIGLELMARAGYNPEEAVSLWRKMAAIGGSKPPQFLSTHPSDETRISHITSLLPRVRPLYRN